MKLTGEQVINRLTWINALRSGKYKQGKASLKTDDGKYCCLGVACAIGLASWDEDKKITECMFPTFNSARNNLGLQNRSNLSFSFALESANDELSQVGDDLGHIVDEGSEARTFTFDEIADCILFDTLYRIDEGV